MELIAKEYDERLLDAEEDILKRMEEAVEGLYFNYEKYIPIPIKVDIPNKKVFIDMVGGKYEWSRIIQEKIQFNIKRRNRKMSNTALRAEPPAKAEENAINVNAANGQEAATRLTQS